MGIMAILLTLTSLNLSSTLPQTSLDSATKTLVGYLKQQQLNALTGVSLDPISTTDQGVHLESNQYTLFQGSSFNVNSTYNFTQKVDDLLITTTFPQSNIIFTKGTGEISGFNPNNNTITLTFTQTQQKKIITLNKYGIIESIN